MFFRRHKRVVNLITGQYKQGPTWTCIGVEGPHGGMYQFIDEQGQVLLTSDFQAV